MKGSKRTFGGNWTTEKLDRVRKYLSAYMQIMKSRNFRVAYIDAFAGTGYVKLKQKEISQEYLLPELADEEAREFIDGSARIALQVEPRFTKYIFIEQSKSRYSQLKKLKEEFPTLKDDIVLIHSDANEYIKNLCAGHDWSGNRAVMFLDPYGMQVSWETIEAIAGTKAIDLWILFPLGVAVNRLIRRDSKISQPVKQRLDNLFGTTDWFEAFYREKESVGLFDTERGLEKSANLDAIGQYFTDRLKTIFAKVADNALPLFNSRNNPLYLLCFAAGNPNGAPIAVKIAQDILRRR
jgi:three-Cys-motif partner protein